MSQKIDWAKYVAEVENNITMSQKIDWAQYVAEAEKNITNNISTVEISSNDDVGQKKVATGAERFVLGADDDSAPQQFGPAEASLLAKVIRKELVENKTDIEVQQKDPKSPLYSSKTFAAFNLNPNLLKGVCKMGFNAPSKIQETVLLTLQVDPPQNLIARSQSGTGKTVAFVLAMLSRVDVSKKYPQGLCLLPSYELAVQTGDVAARMAKFCPEIEMKFAVRGEEMPKGAHVTEHIIIGTPGKVLDWGFKYKVFDLKKISLFVLDEFFELIATQGHQDQCIRIHK